MCPKEYKHVTRHTYIFLSMWYAYPHARPKYPSGKQSPLRVTSRDQSPTPYWCMGHNLHTYTREQSLCAKINYMWDPNSTHNSKVPICGTQSPHSVR